jgi:galactose mutarotase-like enzyme
VAESGHRIEDGSVDGLAEVTLVSEAAEIEAVFVPEAKMLCRSLRDRGAELLGERHGFPAYLERGKTMGIPLLHPWANRVSAERFTLAGREVQIDAGSPLVGLDENGLPIHGLNTAGRGWAVERAEANQERALVEGRLDFASEELLALFPFPHTISVVAELREARLTIRTDVQATTDAGCPVAFGYHPYLKLPNVRREDWLIKAPLDERLVLDPRGIPTGQRKPAEIASGPLGSRTYDDAFVAPRASGPFALEGGGRRIDVAFSSTYPYAQVFAPAADDVICFEPMTAPTNALVTGGSGLPLLGAGESYEAEFTIAVSEPEGP